MKKPGRLQVDTGVEDRHNSVDMKLVNHACLITGTGSGVSIGMTGRAAVQHTSVLAAVHRTPPFHGHG